MGCGCGGQICQPRSGRHYGDLQVITYIINAGLNVGTLSSSGSVLDATSRENAKKACCVALRESEGWSGACNPASCALGWFQFLPSWGFGDRRCSPALITHDFWTVWGPRGEGWHPWHGDIDDDGTLTGAAYLYPRANKAYNDWVTNGGIGGGGGGGGEGIGAGGWSWGTGGWQVINAGGR